MITTAFINIWNKRVGAIAWDVDTVLASFEFESSFLTNKWNGISVENADTISNQVNAVLSRWNNFAA